jgi:hypothetical protein
MARRVAETVAGAATAVVTTTAGATAGVVVGGAFGGVPGALGSLAGSVASTTINLSIILVFGVVRLGALGVIQLSRSLRGSTDDGARPPPSALPAAAQVQPAVEGSLALSNDSPEDEFYAARCQDCKTAFSYFRWYVVGGP